MDIMDVLPVGEANAIPAQELADKCGFRSVRDLQRAIATLRQQGYIICSKGQNDGGYFIHNNRYELQAFVRTLENRARNTLHSLEGARQALQEMGISE